MSILSLLALLLIAGICGSIGQSIAGYSHGGCLVSIALGFVGALLGAYLSQAAGLPDLIVLDLGGVKFPVIWSIIASALFVAVLSLFTRSRHPRE